MIAEAFARKGAALVSADQLAREAVAPGSPALKKLLKRFGARILLKNGELNREMLGQIVFADAQAREALNQITHPAIADLAVTRLQHLKRAAGIPLIVYEAPLLFEAGAEGRVDRILVVKIDPEIQLQRLMRRDQLSEAAAWQRIRAQMPQQEKLARADYVIDNSGPVSEALDQVERLWSQLQGERSEID